MGCSCSKGGKARGEGDQPPVAQSQPAAPAAQSDVGTNEPFHEESHGPAPAETLRPAGDSDVVVSPSGEGSAASPASDLIPAQPPPALNQAAVEKPAKTYRASRQLLGKGGSASVFVGVCEQDRTPVAVKRVVIKDEATRMALEREFDTLKKLPDHDCVVKVRHFEAVGDEGIIVMELVKGGTLRRVCTNAPQKRLHESVIRVYLRDCLLGLHHLHMNGVIHRDLKSDNILVTQKFVSSPSTSSSSFVIPDATCTFVKITDFGSCKDAIHGGVCQTTINVVGTVPYMSPEAVRGKFSRASDMWAFGITFLELATPGSNVWAHLGARDAFGLLLKIGALTDGHHLPPIPEHLSVEARDIITRCLSYQPSDRPSCAELLELPYFADTTHHRPVGMEYWTDYEGSRPA
jgi:serine/threonine protein kinase